MEKNDYFNKALSSFTQDFASGDAIRHLTDLGYSIPDIKERLDYPIPIGKIKEIVWQHLLKQKIILLENPQTASDIKAIYIKETDAMGRTSFRRVEERVELTARSYAVCDFGRCIYRNKEEFVKSLEALDKKDRDYIENLQWPLHIVYHLMDDRMSRIAKVLQLEIV